jgi:LDH2 family malate/lactate/ureidoglycolate dehydrogenase
MWACTGGAMVRAGVQTRRAGQAIVPGTGADGDGARTADPGGLRPAREAEAAGHPPSTL